MRLFNVITNVVGACAVYMVMAACSGASPAPFGAVGDPGAGSSSGSSAGGDGVDSGSGGDGDASTLANDATTGSDASPADSGPVPDANATEASSGTRLKATYYAASDGSKQFAYWSDSARGGERCTFGEPASDGVMRCLPSGPAALYGGNTFFADDHCTLPAYYVTCASPVPAYIFSFDYACGTVSRQHIYVAKAISAIYSGSPSSCSQTSISGTGIQLYGATGPEVDPASFQQASLVTDP